MGLNRAMNWRLWSGRLVKLGMLTSLLTGARGQVNAPLTPAQEEATQEVSEIYKEAEVLRNAGRFSEAIPLVERALSLDEKAFGGEHSYVATDLNNLGNLYMEKGDYKQAESLLQRALAIRMKRPESHAIAPTLNNLAAIYEELGDYQRAEPLIKRGLEITAETFGQDSPEMASGLQGLAVLYSKMGDYDRAKPLYEQALKLVVSKYGWEHPYVATTLDSLAGIYRELGEYDQAEKLYQSALSIYEKVVVPDHPRLATSLNNLALTYHLNGDYAKAEPLYRRALAIHERSVGPTYLEVSIDLSNLAALYQAMGQDDKALATFSRSLEIQQRNLTDVVSISSERAVRAYLSSVGVTFDLFMSAAASGKGRYATGTALTWLLRRKAIILDTLVRLRAAQVLQGQDSEVAKLVEQLRYRRQLLSNLPLNPPQGMTSEDLLRVSTKLRGEIDDYEAELNRALLQKLGKGVVPDVDIGSVRQRLGANTALVEFTRSRVFDFKATGKTRHWYPAQYLAFILQADGTAPVQMVDLGPAAQIDEAIQALRSSVTKFATDWKAGNIAGPDHPAALMSEQDEELLYRRAGRHLCDLVFAPLQKALGAARVIYLSPDDQLNLIPFEALVNADGKYLIENYSFDYLSSGRDLLRPPTAQGEGTVVFADPDYNVSVSARAQKLRSLLDADQPPAAPPRMDSGPGVISSGPPPATVQASSRQVRGGSWDKLLFSATEALDVEKELSGTIYSGKDGVKVYSGESALEEVFKRVRSPRVLHVSTHGFFPNESRGAETEGAPLDLQTGSIAVVGQKLLQRADDPLLSSGLVLAGANKIGESLSGENESRATSGVDDGWVTAEEIAMMNLEGTELVMLSACGSGLGAVSAGEGVYGLRRAFQNAGAGTIITTLFEVPDRESEQMVKGFYEGLKNKRGKLNALREAQLKVIAERRGREGAAHPFFWAGFVLAGGPD